MLGEDRFEDPALMVDQHVGEPGVLGHHALGLPGRSGGVDRVRGVPQPVRIVRGERDVRLRLGQRAVQFDQLAAQPGRDAAHGEDHLGPRVLDDGRDPLVRVVQLQRYVRGADPQYGEERRDPVGRARDRQAHGRLRTDPPLGEHARHGPAAVAEFGEGHGRAVGDEGDALRMAVGREVEAVHDGVRADVGTFGGLGVRSKAPQSAHPPRRRARHVLQHAQVVVQEAAGGLRIAVAVLQLDGEPVARGDDPGVRVVGGIVRLDGGDAVAGVHRGEGVQVQEVLEHEEVVEQGVEPGGPLDLPEPQVLVVHRRDPGCLDGRQVGADRLLGPRPRPHGHGVEEYADDVAVPLALPARDGHAEHGVAAAGAGAEEEAERTGQHRVQGDPVDPGGFPEQLRQLGGERVHDRLRQLLTEGRGRSGEQRRSRQTRQVLRPEAFPYGGVLGGEGPGVLLEARHGRGGVPRLPRGEGLVRLEQVAQQDLAGPAVPEQQVVAEQQAVTAVGQPHRGQPDQRWLPRVEAARAVPGAQGFDLGVRGEARPCGRRPAGPP